MRRAALAFLQSLVSIIAVVLRMIFHIMYNVTTRSVAALRATNARFIAYI